MKKLTTYDQFKLDHPAKRHMTQSAFELFKFIRTHSACRSAGQIARLLMSIHNGRTRVSFYDDLQGFDDTIIWNVRAVVAEFFTGLYKDGDFKPVAEWLIDHAGYLDDVSREERDQWCRENLGLLRANFAAILPVPVKSPSALYPPGGKPSWVYEQLSEQQCEFEAFCHSSWKTSTQ